MSGEELYEQWQQCMLEHANTDTDGWDDLTDGERAAWDWLAHLVSS